MKKFVLFIFATILANTLLAQGSKRSFISLSGFLPQPLGSYKSTDKNEERSGYAKYGFGIGLEGALFFHPNVGVGGNVGMHEHWIDMDAYENERNDLVQGIENATVREVFNEKLGGSVQPYKIKTLFVGPFFTLPLKKVSLDAKFLVGYVLFTGIKEDIRLQYQTVFLHSVNSPSSVSTIGINPGIAARIKFSNSFSFKAGIDYIFAKPSYTSTVSTILVDEEEIITSQEMQNKKLNLSFFNLSLGICFEFNKN